MLVLFHIYINSTNIPPNMIINRIYENQNLLSPQHFSLPGWAKDLSGPPVYTYIYIYTGVLISPQPDLLPSIFCLMVRIFRLMLVFLYIYINSTNIPPIMIINRIYENQNLLSLQSFAFVVGLRTYQQPSIKSRLRIGGGTLRLCEQDRRSIIFTTVLI